MERTTCPQLHLRFCSALLDLQVGMMKGWNRRASLALQGHQIFFPSISLASSPPHKLRWGKLTLKFQFHIVQKLKMLVNNSMTNFSKWRRKSVKIWRDLRRQKWRVLKLHEHSVWIRVSSYDVQTNIPGKNSHSTVGLFGFPSFCLQT